MSFIDAIIDKQHDTIHVVERVNGERIYKEFPANYVVYVDDKKGKYSTIFGKPVSKITCRTGKEFQKEIRSHSGNQLWEKDFNLVFRCLEENYSGALSPKLQTAFFDIETAMQPYAYKSSHMVKIRKRPALRPIQSDGVLVKDVITVFALGQIPNKPEYEVFDEKSNKWTDIGTCRYLEGGPGYAPTDDPFNEITAISVYLDWLDKLITLALPPPGMDRAEADAIAAKYDNCFLFDDEVEMLDTFLNIIDDADIISGWNSEGYDIPYTVNRVRRLMSKDDTRRFCLWGQYPKPRIFERYGKESSTYDLIGRVHLDYMQLYIKYTYHEMHSYSLDAISEYELSDTKLAYEGTLDQLYNQNFDTFLDYNRQDTVLLGKLDKKLRFLDLANELAHSNTVLLQTTMGAVAVTEQAIINEAHQRGMIVPNRKSKDETNTAAAGAYVAYPKKGMHDYIGAIDINSLYPSAIRALNMGPETIVGQLRPHMTNRYIDERMATGISRTAAWEGLFGSLEYNAVMEMDPNVDITVDWEESGESTTHSAADVWQMVFNSKQPWVISANGTIFRYDVKGVIPGLLERWYSDRKVMQRKKKDTATIAGGVQLTPEFAALLTGEYTGTIPSAGVFEPDEVNRLAKAEDIALIPLMHQFKLAVKDGKLVFTDAESGEYWVNYWDKKQMVTKINLNSLYGALLNQGCRFFDARIGQSTTLTGRTIAKHMHSHINEAFTGKYDHEGDAIIYGDSVTGDTIIRTDINGSCTIAELFDKIMYKTIQDGGKEYAIPTSTYDDIKVLGYNAMEDTASLANIAYVMRHATTKKKWKITADDGTSVTVTDDHSIMVDRDGFTIEVKPSELLPDDLLITVDWQENATVELDTQRKRIASAECLGEFDNEYVYDISIKNQDPFFFANDILVHNTDSSYFSAWPMLKADVEAGKMEWNNDICIKLYDSISDSVNESFPIFMEKACHCPQNLGALIKGGRELVASKGLFITKKRYAVLIVDLEGKRLDVDGKTGKVKAMGLDLKRSDTPKIVQTFLSDILSDTLNGVERTEIIEKIINFKKQFSDKAAWEKGTPKRVNNLTKYGEAEAAAGKATMPGHVRAAINWNNLKRMHGDNYSMSIVDGMKTIVCKLRTNPMGLTSVGYPTDIKQLPDWFKELPFDDSLMETVIVDQKVGNLLGVLKWDLETLTDTKTTFQSLFSF